MRGHFCWAELWQASTGVFKQDQVSYWGWQNILVEVPGSNSWFQKPYPSPKFNSSFLTGESLLSSVFKINFLSPFDRDRHHRGVGEKNPVHAKRMGFFVDGMDGKLDRKTQFYWCRKTMKNLP